MKKSILIIAVVFLSLSSHAQSGFESSNLRIGLGLLYATEIDNVGLNLTGTYSLTSFWEGSVGFSHIFKKNYSTWNILDLDGHYIFFDDDSGLNVYGLAGLSLAFWKVKTDAISYAGMTIPEQTASGTEAGLNIGVGMNYKLSDRLNIAPEIRYTIMDGSYLRLGVAVQYMLD